MSNAVVEEEQVPAMGRVSALGPTQPWQLALLLPTSFDDLRTPRTTLDGAHDGPDVFCLRVAGAPSSRFGGRGPRVAVMLEDDQGTPIRGIAFGPPRDIMPLLVTGRSVVLRGALRDMGDREILSITEIVPEAEAGGLRPTYPGKPKVIGAPRVRELVRAHLDAALPVAAEYLAQELAPIGRINTILTELGCHGWTLEQILEQAHRPRDPEYACHAHDVLDRMAALIALARAEASRPPVGQHQTWRLATLGERMRAWPYELTVDQRTAVERLASGMATARPLRALLSGDVGSGKTSVFCTLVASLTDAGGRAAILLPNEVLVAQIRAEIEATFPDVALTSVTTETPVREDLVMPRVLIGTTALLHREIGPIDLLVIDEQQKFGVKARQQLLGVSSHLLECSATCIPRTLALARYGVVDVLELRKTHVEKDIRTRIRPREDGRELFTEVAETLRDGNQVLVIYPLAEAGGESPRHSVELAGQRWERIFPGRVRTLIGADDGETKRRVLNDFRTGKAQIMIGTTVVEVGVDLKRLRHVVVVHPERFGLSTLHQIRGRAARQGGVGQFDLYCPDAISDATHERLAVLERTQDGFEVAERDLCLRGFGDMRAGATAQSGGDESVLFGRPVTTAAVDAIAPLWARFVEEAKGSIAG